MQAEESWEPAARPDSSVAPLVAQPEPPHAPGPGLWSRSLQGPTTQHITHRPAALRPCYSAASWPCPPGLCTGYSSVWNVLHTQPPPPSPHSDEMEPCPFLAHQSHRPFPSVTGLCCSLAHVRLPLQPGPHESWGHVGPFVGTPALGTQCSADVQRGLDSGSGLRSLWAPQRSGPSTGLSAWPEAQLGLVDGGQSGTHLPGLPQGLRRQGGQCTAGASDPGRRAPRGSSGADHSQVHERRAREPSDTPMLSGISW